VERVFWSAPLSLAVSTIGAVLIGKFVSLTAVAILLMANFVVCIALLGREGLNLGRSGQKWRIGFRPLGAKALALVLVWVAVVIVLLIDFQSDQRLYMSLAMFDHSMRVNWTESVLRTGVPPANWLYMFGHPAPMRYYYFWYVLCALVARISGLPARAVLIASCAWSGFFVASTIGLYLKHFLLAGERLRRQFLVTVGLLAVTGLGVCINLVDFFYYNQPLPGSLEVWKAGQISSWLDSILWVPHHVAGCVCCMFGFLLAWMSEQASTKQSALTVLLIAAAFASAFGLSIYVAFAFFVVAGSWALWQVLLRHAYRSALLIAAGGVGAALLLIPFLLELTHGTSNVGGPSVFAFSIRETVPTAGLLSWPMFQHLATSNPGLAQNLAKLLLLVPGYCVGMGFYCVVLLVFLIPILRSRTPLTRPQASLVFLSVATLVLMSFVRSGVIDSNDFGWRAALLLQFTLLLLASDFMVRWKVDELKKSAPTAIDGLPGSTPYLVRAVASLALIFGVMTTMYQALMIRYDLQLREVQLRKANDLPSADLAHKAYISAVEYPRLDAVIPHNAVVQYNPWTPDLVWLNTDWLNVGHQSVIYGDGSLCGSEFGGDPTGCAAMTTALDAVYSNATASQAEVVCRQFGIQYLVARVYDSAWKNGSSWVWTLKPVVADAEFRALDCR